MKWFALSPVATGHCATEGCRGQPTARLEAGGVGSIYCAACTARIMAGDSFHIQLTLARMAVGLAGRHQNDAGAAGTVHQVRRLAQSYRDQGETDRAEKLQRLVDWFDAGAVPSGDALVLSETEVRP